MADPYIGEIRMFAGNFPPAGWHFCNGEIREISDDPDLFEVIGDTYGGDNTETFALPDMQGRVPVHQATGFSLGSRTGTEVETLTAQQIPTHVHALLGSTALGTSNNPQGNLPASLPAAGAASAYGNAQNLVLLDPTSLAPAGGSQPHENMQPYLCISFIIARFGIFPTPG